MMANTYPSFQSIKVVNSDRVVEVVFSNPKIRNAFSAQSILEISKAFEIINLQKDISVVILKGEGPSFCAGADLSWMQSMVKFSFQENLEDSQKLFKMFKLIYDCPHTVIGRVHGHAMGGGVGLVAVCDIVAAQKETKFSFSEVKLGLVPAVISPFVLKKVSAPSGLEVMLTGEIFDADKAMSIGLVHFVGTDEEVDDFVFGRADMIVSNGPTSVKETKRLIRMSMGEISDSVKSAVTECIAKQRVSPEGQEGLKAFFEKRKPAW